MAIQRDFCLILTRDTRADANDGTFHPLRSFSRRLFCVRHTFSFIFILVIIFVVYYIGHAPGILPGGQLTWLGRVALFRYVF